MEYLDVYDEEKKYLGRQTRDDVHSKALWHNTVHCWLYDSNGNIYFQIRADEKKFYTTASGHVLAGETIKEGFGREIKEEIGIELDYDKAELVDIVIWKMDKEKADGSVFRDRAFANVYIYNYDKKNFENFKFDDELDGVVKVNAKEMLELIKKGSGKIGAELIIKENNKNIKINRNVDLSEFLVNINETAIEKYGYVLNKVIEVSSNNLK